MKSFAFTFLGWILVAQCLSQEIYHFTKGLALSTPVRYGREAVYTDPVAHAIYSKTIISPKEGATFVPLDTAGAPVWQLVQADSANRLFARGPGRNAGFGRSGYMYLTYTSDRDKTALLNISGNNGLFFNGDPHTGDPYRSGWLHIPVKLKKGLNELYVRGLFITASLSFPVKPVLLKTDDPTLPHIVLNGNNDSLQAAVVVINTTSNELKGLSIRSNSGGNTITTGIPSVPAMSFRKVAFRLDGSKVIAAGKHVCRIVLLQKEKVLDETNLPMEAVAATNPYSSTFISGIDGSLQYYAVTPQSKADETSSAANTATNNSASDNNTDGHATGANQNALFLSVHGAGVEAIGQARAYQSKNWGTLVAATNRRPRGFNWEDWGRLDALEVLQLAKDKFRPDPDRIYLTGHSMGGHGTWFLGATYPDKWAAIAPCAGYPTLKGYGSADGLIPDSSSHPMEKILLRSGNQSDVIRLATNYKPLGVYVFHGDDDRTVSVNYARQMKKVLADFHSDLSYYEYPGGSHWFGNHSVDWKPLFDFFHWHSRPHDTAVNGIDFITASPGISASFYWAAIHQQEQPLEYSRIQLKRNKAGGTITGATTNVRLLKFNLEDFSSGSAISITLDGGAPLSFTPKRSNDSVFLRKENGEWRIVTAPDLYQKGPHRYGTFKEAFNHHMVFVYGTGGTQAENEWSRNKARYDAETWYYRGNGAVDIVADKDFSLNNYKDRGVILYGNKTTNKAWDALLDDCPIQVERNQVTAGNKIWKGDDLGAYFVWPIRHSSKALVGVVAGTGVKGMKAADANQYFAGASGFPDFMIFGLEMLIKGANEIRMAGFFDYNWKLNAANFVQGD